MIQYEEKTFSCEVWITDVFSFQFMQKMAEGREREGVRERGARLTPRKTMWGVSKEGARPLQCPGRKVRAKRGPKRTRFTSNCALNLNLQTLNHDYWTPIYQPQMLWRKQEEKKP